MFSKITNAYSFHIHIINKIIKTSEQAEFNVPTW